MLQLKTTSIGLMLMLVCGMVFATPKAPNFVLTSSLDTPVIIAFEILDGDGSRSGLTVLDEHNLKLAKHLGPASTITIRVKQRCDGMTTYRQIAQRTLKVPPGEKLAARLELDSYEAHGVGIHLTQKNAFVFAPVVKSSKTTSRNCSLWDLLRSSFLALALWV